MARVVWGLILLVLVAFFVPVNQAQAATYSEAAASCAAYASAHPETAQWTSYTCSDGTAGQCSAINGGPNDNSTPSVNAIATFKSNGSRNCVSFTFTGLPPTDQQKCMAMPPKTGVLMAATNVCVSGCNYSPSDDGGRVFTVKGIDGSMRTAGGGTYAPTGAICNGGPSVPAPVTDPLPPRKLCGGGSCHDVAAGQFCAVNSVGAQVCISDKPPAGSPGGCVTSGDTTLCAGNPPPMPPNPPVVDPASQIAASDKYTDSAAGTTTNNSTVNNYNHDGATPNSGAGADDNKPPASSSSSPTPSDPTKAGGGGDCNTPPMCEGAAATCMVVTQTYLLRCPPGGSGNGPGESDGDTTVPGLDGVGETPGAGFMREESLLDKLDQGGFGGGGQCPKLLSMDIDMYGVHSDSTGLPWCDILGKAGNMLLLLAAFISYRILSEK